MIQLTPLPNTQLIERHDATGTPSTSGYLHGPNGLLRYPGVDPTMLHTIVGSLPGVLNQIPTRPTNVIHPLFQVITGIGDGSGDEPDGVCDDAPVGGIFQAGMHTAPFGRYMRQTVEVDVGSLGRRVDNAEPMDLRLANQLPALTPIANASGVLGNPLASEWDRLFYARGMAFHRLLSKQIWTGNSANNNGDLDNGGYREFEGLAKQINTGWIDARTGSVLPTLNGDVRSFGGVRIDSNGDKFVAMLSNMWRNLGDLADRTGIGPVRYAFVMRPQLYWEITSIYPCAYGTNMCSTSGSDTINQDRGDLLNFRDDMRRNRYLLIDGERVEVILDDAIPETEPAKGVFQSDIYLLPFSVLGGRLASIYLEYYDFGNADTRAAVASAAGAIKVIANGAFLDALSVKNYCLKWQARIEPRLIVRTPWLAGRITNVRYAPIISPRQSFPDDPYYVDGGATSVPGPSYYSTFA